MDTLTLVLSIVALTVSLVVTVYNHRLWRDIKRDDERR